MSGPGYVPIDLDDSDVLEKNIDRFEQQCIKNGISFRVHRDFNDFALPELKRETRFADLLIISSEKFFEDISGHAGIEYMKNAIHESECPVIVIPEKYAFPKRNIIAYDGTASSVYAMKQFAYLFPELTHNETLLVYSKDEKNTGLPDEQYAEELATQHYKDLTLLKLQVQPEKFFYSWLQDEPNPILICGAFGRSSLSQMFKKSFVTEVITGRKLPLFIAHK
jgi:hypothetical protein